MTVVSPGVTGIALHVRAHHFSFKENAEAASRLAWIAWTRMSNSAIVLRT